MTLPVILVSVNMCSHCENHFFNEKESQQRWRWIISKRSIVIVVGGIRWWFQQNVKIRFSTYQLEWESLFKCQCVNQSKMRSMTSIWIEIVFFLLRRRYSFPIESRPCARMMNLRQSSSLAVSPRTNSYEMNFIWQMCERIDHHADDAEPKDEQHVRLTQPTSEWIYPRVRMRMFIGGQRRNRLSQISSIEIGNEISNDSQIDSKRTIRPQPMVAKREREIDRELVTNRACHISIHPFIRCRDLMFLSHLDRMEIHL